MATKTAAKTKPAGNPAGNRGKKSPSSVEELFANPANPRKPWNAEQSEAFKKSLQEFGDLSGVVRNVTTDQLVGGHKRVDEFKQDKGAKLVIVDRLAKTDAAGTKAYGHILLSSGARFAYREVEWSKAKEAAANLAANKWGAEWDWEGVGALMLEAKDGEFDLSLTGFASDELGNILDGNFDAFTGNSDVEEDEDETPADNSENAYSGKIAIPVYKPRGDKPAVKELVDITKTKTIINTIEKAGIKDAQIVEFLKAAAQRHNVFNYEKIAEFYAHASKEIQTLMEDSALVIIDYDKAIEKGYAILTERMKQLSKDSDAAIPATA